LVARRAHLLSQPQIEISQPGSEDQKEISWVGGENKNIIKLPDGVKLPDSFDLGNAIARPLRIEDTPHLKKHFTYGIACNFSKQAVRWPLSDGAFEDYIQRKIFSMWLGLSIVYVILPKGGEDANKPVGIYDFHFEKVNGISNRAYWIGKDNQGKGIMGKMVDAMDDFLFGVLELASYLVSNVPGNIASQKIKTSRGFQLTTDPELLSRAAEIEYHMLDEKADKTQSRKGAQVWEVKREGWLERRLAKQFGDAAVKKFEQSPMPASIPPDMKIAISAPAVPRHTFGTRARILRQIAFLIARNPFRPAPVLSITQSSTPQKPVQPGSKHEF